MQDEQPTQPGNDGQPKPRGKRGVALAAGLLAAGAIAGGVLASATGASAAGTSSAGASSSGASSTTEATPSTGSPAPGGGPSHNGRPDHKGGGGAAPVRSDEKQLTGADAAKAKAAALKAVPGATVYRVETDAGDGVYEAHVTKADGTQVTVKLDKNFAVTKVESGMGAGDPALHR